MATHTIKFHDVIRNHFECHIKSEYADHNLISSRFTMTHSINAYMYGICSIFLMLCLVFRCHLAVINIHNVASNNINHILIKISNGVPMLSHINAIINGNQKYR
jgi:hypothetical protein